MAYNMLPLADKSLKLSWQASPNSQAIDPADIILEEKSACTKVMLGDEDETLPSYEDDVNIGHDNDSQSNGPVEPSGGVIDLIQQSEIHHIADINTKTRLLLKAMIPRVLEIPFMWRIAHAR